MSKLSVLATFAASVLFAACEHGAPQPGPREMQPMSSPPTQVEPGTPMPSNGDPTASEARPAPGANPALPSSQARPGGVQTRGHDGPIAIPPADAGTPLPGTALPSPTGAINPGPSAMLETRRDLHSDDDLRLLPPAQQMPVTNIPAQPMPAGPGTPGESEPSSVKPDGGILFDGGAPLPPIPDGGPLPQTRDASIPL
jgi:hypothetical protein